jgi:predicted phosphate transport protein (TIGR00153 family)
MNDYFSNNTASFDLHVKQVSKIEHEADDLLKIIKHDLYAFMLIPDTRGDVFRFMNDLDTTIDYSKQLLVQLSIQKPQFPKMLIEKVDEVLTETVQIMEYVIEASLIFFSQPSLVEEKVKAIFVCEERIDSMEEKIERAIFSDKLSLTLAERLQLTQFCQKISSISDLGEDIARDLVIFALKRMV